MDQPVLDVIAVGKTYKNADIPSLSDVSLTVFEGEKLGVFGPNGAGKTTLISIMCRLLEPTVGDVRYYTQGKVVSAETMMPLVGYVPQDFAFYEELTPDQNLRFFGGVYKIKEHELHNRIDSLLDRLGLAYVRSKKVASFSGGMKRRLNLAIGLINNPVLLFLDEPTVGVDVQSKMAIMDLLNELNRNGTSIVYTSHQLKEAEGFCDRVALIDSGKIIEVDQLTRLFEAHSVSDLEELLISLTGIKLRD